MPTITSPTRHGFTPYAGPIGPRFKRQGQDVPERFPETAALEETARRIFSDEALTIRGQLLAFTAAAVPAIRELRGRLAELEAFDARLDREVAEKLQALDERSAPLSATEHAEALAIATRISDSPTLRGEVTQAISAGNPRGARLARLLTGLDPLVSGVSEQQLQTWRDLAAPSLPQEESDHYQTAKYNAMRERHEVITEIRRIAGSCDIEALREAKVLPPSVRGMSVEEKAAFIAANGLDRYRQRLNDEMLFQPLMYDPQAVDTAVSEAAVETQQPEPVAA